MRDSKRRDTPRVRVDRALSKLGVASRAEARRLILAGRVQVDGRVIHDPGRPIAPEQTRIAVDGHSARMLRLRGPRGRSLALNKPRGVVTTRRDPEGRRTVFDLLGDEAHGLVAVGRLDMASTGLLLLTTDTSLANRLTDPANAVVRRYLVTARGEVTDDEAARMMAGIEGLVAAQVTIRKRSRRETHLIVELTEGKNREIRRLLQAVGHEVTRLKRVAFGGIELGELAPGDWRELTQEEMTRALGPPGRRLS